MRFDMAIFPNRGVPTRRRTRIGAALAALALIGLGLYGTALLRANLSASPCGPASAALARMRPLAAGEVAAFDVADRARPAPDLGFVGPDGRPSSLHALRGRTVLLNLWATWCLPCKQEMPALDRLQAELGGPNFQVVAVNIDTRNTDRPKAWLAEAGIRNLAYYSDREAKIFQDLRRDGDADGMPTTILVDPNGCRLGRMSGPAEWASPDGEALIRAAL